LEYSGTPFFMFVLSGIFISEAEVATKYHLLLSLSAQRKNK